MAKLIQKSFFSEIIFVIISMVSLFAIMLCIVVWAKV